MANRDNQPDLTGLVDEVGKEQVLALGSGDGVILVGTRTRLAQRADGQWQSWPWESVAAGSWRSEDGRFKWRTFDGEQYQAELTSPGALPELFRERVQASTLLTSVLDVPGGQVQIIGRRPLTGEDNINWYAIASGRADLTEETTRALVVAKTDALAQELG